MSRNWVNLGRAVTPRQTVHPVLSLVLIFPFIAVAQQAGAATLVADARQPSNAADELLHFDNTASGLSPSEVLAAGNLGKDQATADEALARQLAEQGSLLVPSGMSQVHQANEVAVEPAPRTVPKVVLFGLTAFGTILVVSGASLVVRWLGRASAEAQQPPPMVFDLPRS